MRQSCGEVFDSTPEITASPRVERRLEQGVVLVVSRQEIDHEVTEPRQFGIADVEVREVLGVSVEKPGWFITRVRISTSLREKAPVLAGPA